MTTRLVDKFDVWYFSTAGMCMDITPLKLLRKWLSDIPEKLESGNQCHEVVTAAPGTWSELNAWLYSKPHPAGVIDGPNVAVAFEAAWPEIERRVTIMLEAAAEKERTRTNEAIRAVTDHFGVGVVFSEAGVLK